MVITIDKYYIYDKSLTLRSLDQPMSANNRNSISLFKYIGYTRTAGFGRREIEYMQALCIYNKYRV